MTVIFKAKDLHKLKELLCDSESTNNTSYISRIVNYHELDNFFSLIYSAALENDSRKIRYLENFYEYVTILLLDQYADEINNIPLTVKPRSKAAQLRVLQDAEAERHIDKQVDKQEWSQSMFGGESNERFK